MNHPIELWIIAGGFVVVSVITLIGYLDALWREAKAKHQKRDPFAIKRRLFRDGLFKKPMAVYTGEKK